MDFLYGVVPTLIVLLGILIAWLCIRRIASLRAKRYSLSLRIAEAFPLAVVALLALAVAASSGINALILHRYRTQMPGALYLVDGHRLRLDCTGSGSPTLVLDAGLGNDGLIWSAVQPTLSQTTRVCSYDRAGMGWSDPVATPRDADHIAAQLHGLLQAAGVTGPIVLMGHSIAGLYIRDYAAHFPDQVVGLVFVDASTPLQNRNPIFAAEMRRPSTLLVFVTQARFVLGIPRLLGACSHKWPGFSPQLSRLQSEDRCHIVVSSPLGESLNFDRSGEETLHTGPWTFPILVLTEDPSVALANHQPPVGVETWNQMQANLRNLSPHSRQIIAARSSHYIQLDRPDVIDREVPLFIRQIRGAAPAAAWGTTTTE